MSMFDVFKKEKLPEDVADRFNKLADDKKALEEQVSTLQKQVSELEIMNSAFIKRDTPVTVEDQIIQKLVKFIKLFNNKKVRGYILHDEEVDDKIKVHFEYWREE